MIADGLHISSERALDLFYRSNVYEMLVDPRYGLQTMSDAYIYDEFMMELRGQWTINRRCGLKPQRE